MMQWLGKKYKLSSSENFDEFMQALGVGFITRKAANAVTPTVELKKEGDAYNLVTSSTFKTTKVKFVPGEECDEERADGAKCKSVYTLEGNTLKQVQKAADGVEVTYIREFGPEEMKAFEMPIYPIPLERQYFNPCALDQSQNPWDQ